MNARIRNSLLVFAFSATAAAALTGASLRGETKEPSLAETCAATAWPMIPSACLEGGVDHEVRMVALHAMAGRFAAAFE